MMTMMNDDDDVDDDGDGDDDDDGDDDCRDPDIPAAAERSVVVNTWILIFDVTVAAMIVLEWVVPRKAKYKYFLGQRWG